MNIFQKIKESVTTRQAAEMYGLRVNRNGMVCCPFHNDKADECEKSDRVFETK